MRRWRGSPRSDAAWLRTMPSTSAHDLYGVRFRGWVFFVNDAAVLVDEPGARPWRAWAAPPDGVTAALLQQVLEGLRQL